MFRIIFNKCVEKYYVTFGIVRSEMTDLKKVINWLKIRVDDMFGRRGWKPLFEKLENHINITQHIKNDCLGDMTFENREYSIKIHHNIYGQQKRHLQYNICFYIRGIFQDGGIVIVERKRSPKKCSK
jgi:hypothetical protein